MEKNTKMPLRTSTRKITIFSIFTAISVILGFTPLGIIPIPPVGATIMHIPVIIIGILEGPVAGALMGLVFGIISIIRAITTGSILLFAFLNPLVSVVPRILIGVMAYYSYKIIPSKNEVAKIGISAAIGTFINTLGFLGMMYIVYSNKVSEALSISQNTVGKTLFAIGTTHGIPEIFVAVIITVPIVVSVKKMIKN